MYNSRDVERVNRGRELESDQDAVQHRGEVSRGKRRNESVSGQMEQNVEV